MWLCTQHGFFSIVQKRPNEFHVRARMKRDLENLNELWAGRMRGARVAGARKPFAKIHRSEDADYRWRMVICQPDVIMLLACLGNAIDYTNFKSRINISADQHEKSGAYGDLWSSLHALQR